MAFGVVANRYTRDIEQIRLFLNASAVGDNDCGMLLQSQRIKNRYRFNNLNPTKYAIIQAVSFNSVPCSWVYWKNDGADLNVIKLSNNRLLYFTLL